MTRLLTITALALAVAATGCRSTCKDRYGAASLPACDSTPRFAFGSRLMPTASQPVESTGYVPVSMSGSSYPVQGYPVVNSPIAATPIVPRVPNAAPAGELPFPSVTR